MGISLDGVPITTEQQCIDFSNAVFTTFGVARWKESLAVGRIRYDGAAAADCIAAIEGVSCDDYDTSDIAIQEMGCRPFLLANVGSGGACTQDYECMTSNCVGQDTSPDEGPPIDGTCETEPTLGQPCDDDCAEACFASSTCRRARISASPPRPTERSATSTASARATTAMTPWTCASATGRAARAADVVRAPTSTIRPLPKHAAVHALPSSPWQERRSRSRWSPSCSVDVCGSATSIAEWRACRWEPTRVGSRCLLPRQHRQARGTWRARPRPPIRSRAAKAARA